MLTTTVVHAEIKFISIYECATCAACKSGTTAHSSFRVNSLESLITVVQNLTQRSHDMPVGWASYAGGVFKYERCKT